MKAILEFNIPEEQDEFNDSINGTKYKSKIEDLWNELFRPFSKHGYENDRINQLLTDEKCVELLENLIDIFHEVADD